MPKHHKQSSASEGLAQGPYSVAARVAFEPATLRTQGTESITEPPQPHYKKIKNTNNVQTRAGKNLRFFKKRFVFRFYRFLRF